MTTATATVWRSVAQTARFLEVSQSLIYKDVKLGRLNAWRSPTGWLIEEEEIERYRRLREAGSGRVSGTGKGYDRR